MANQCDLYGQLTLKEGVTMNHMRLAMHNFITHFGLDFDHCEASGHIGIEQTGDSLTLSLCIENIWGRGGYLNEPIDELCSQLGPFTSMPGWLHLIDQDTGDSSAARTPYFVGADAEAISLARLHYALDQFKDHVGDSLTDQSVQAVHDFCISLHGQALIEQASAANASPINPESVVR